MLRALAIVAALATAAVSPLASAQTSGGITLTFGTGGYSSYGDGDDDDDYGYGYGSRGGYSTYNPQVDQRYDYQNRYVSQAYQRDLQLYQWRLQQWQQDQQRRLYWEQQRRIGHDWRYDYDDDDD
ncbi:hypothetical protein [Sphingomonas sp. GB1N7]|uniref:hypothetical protein n=1 Tax=Parasphingomonas caseinilytica TaxID=3096158 RepID=UPI002FC8ED14